MISCDESILFNGLSDKTPIAKEEAINILQEAVALMELDHKRKVF